MGSIIEKTNGLFWTREDEMVEELEELGFSVDDVNGEYVSVYGENEEAIYILYLGHANTTMWVERVREIY